MVANASSSIDSLKNDILNEILSVCFHLISEAAACWKSFHFEESQEFLQQACIKATLVEQQYLLSDRIMTENDNGIKALLHSAKNMIAMNQGILYYLSKEFKKAQYVFQEIILRQTFGMEEGEASSYSPSPRDGIATAKEMLAMCYRKLGRYEEAAMLHLATLQTKADDSLEAASTYLNLGHVYLEGGNCEEALKNYTEALRIHHLHCHDTTDTDSAAPPLAMILHFIARALMKLGRFSSALQFLAEARSVYLTKTVSSQDNNNSGVVVTTTTTATTTTRKSHAGDGIVDPLLVSVETDRMKCIGAQAGSPKVI
mmetsp:Transcript_12852/g.18499  ORF Transcript_12852/g.18499 Transcript_12852/m.18499 type:complete len:314 (+) Transcript_12852:653-1594(+)